MLVEVNEIIVMSDLKKQGKRKWQSKKRRNKLK